MGVMARPWLLAATALLAAPLGCAHSARHYFGHIETQPDCREQRCAFRDLLRRLDAECPRVDERCALGDAVLGAVFGGTYRRSMADYLVYLEQTPGPRGPQFRKHAPVLMYEGENTPYLYGARDVFAVVFSERRACVTARVTTIYRNDPNPFSTVLAALGTNVDPAAPKPTERTSAAVRWLPLSGNPADTGLWVGMAPFAIDENSTVRITLEYSPPRKKGGDDKSQADLPEECVGPPASAQAGVDPAGPTSSARAEPAQPEPEYSGDFLSANGFVSDSPGGWAALSFALGASGNVRGTAVASGGSRFTVNGYAAAKFYLLRPRINVAPDAWKVRRTSLAVFAGTGIKSPFDELVFGLSIGHLVGNAGLLLGGNSIAGPREGDTGRTTCWFGGIDYSF